MNWYIASYSRKQGDCPYYLNFSAESIESAREEARKRIMGESRTYFDAQIKGQNEGEWKTLDTEIKRVPSTF